ncbi:MAG: glycerate kinase [Sphaerochaetaceae bacterium]
MKKVITIVDSFKGTMSSSQINQIVKEAVLSFYTDAEVISVAVADGGEGTVEAFLMPLGGEKVAVEVTGPYFEKMESYYGITDDKTAIIEMASCCGLPLVIGRENPGETTTFGLGGMILDAAKKGCKKIIVGLGGSATNDGGVGAAAAVGFKFIDRENKSFIPVGKTLNQIDKIESGAVNPLLKDVEIITMSDVENPLYGLQGAAYIFAPQKGADSQMVKELDDNLRKLALLIKRDLKIDISSLKGGGAAGGCGSAMVAFFNSKLEMGIEVLLDTIEFDSLIKDADFIFTGEGKIDTQSLRGKVVSGVAKRAKRNNIPLIALVGDIGDDIQEFYDMGVSAIFSINRVAKEYKEVANRAPSDLKLTLDNLMRFLQRLGF